jgi:hypothetical protein
MKLAALFVGLVLFGVGATGFFVLLRRIRVNVDLPTRRVDVRRSRVCALLDLNVVDV